MDKIIIEFILKMEGGYVNNQKDPGGETKYGISKRAYPNVDIKNLTKNDAIAIYYRDYWLRCGANNFPFPLAACVMDTAVNMGVGRAKQFLRQTADWKEFIRLRREWYSKLVVKNPTLSRFLRGWNNRLDHLTKFIDSNSRK